MLEGAGQAKGWLLVLIALVLVVILVFIIIYGSMIYSKLWSPGDLLKELFPDWEKGNVKSNVQANYPNLGSGALQGMMPQ